MCYVNNTVWYFRSKNFCSFEKVQEDQTNNQALRGRIKKVKQEGKKNVCVKTFLIHPNIKFLLDTLLH